MESASEPVNEGKDTPAVTWGLRPSELGDMDFIVDSWRRSYDDSEHPRCPGGIKEYIATQRQVIMHCLDTSKVLVAYPQTPEPSPQQIGGWLCYRPAAPFSVVAHYLYVKAPFRRAGIARQLLQHVAMETGTIVQLYSTHVMPRHLHGSWFGKLRILHNPALIFGDTP